MCIKQLIGVVAALVVVAAPAYAHVRVAPAEAARGTVVELTFRVPNERDDSGATKVEVFMPTDHPLAVVEVKPKDGWTSSTERTPLAAPVADGRGGTVSEVVSKIIWEGGPINPDGTEEFGISVGPLPSDADRLFFKSLQTYASGEVVRWIDEVSTGSDRPAPVLKLTGVAPATTPTTSTSTSTSTSTTAPLTTAPSSAPPTEVTFPPGTLPAPAEQPPAESGGGGMGLVFGGLAVALVMVGGWLGFRRRRRGG